MLEKLIAYTLKQRGMVIFFALMIVGFGFYSYLKLPIDAFPDVTNIQVEVVSHADGLSAVEIERNVTYPIEMAMRGLPDIEQMRSVTKFGLSIVTIVFKDNVDIYFARQLVFERLAEAREKVPKGVQVAMGPIGTAMGEIYQYTLEGKVPQDPEQKRAYLTNLRTMQEWVITPQLKSVAGVNEINSFGGYFKQYQVLVSPEKLVKYGVTVDDVYSAIGSNNSNVGGNVLERGTDQYIVRGVGLIQSISDIENIVLKSQGGTAIETADVALMDDDLRKVAVFVQLSRTTSAILKQNIALALGIKVVFLVLTLMGHATMWMAVFADMGASLLVVGNGLRLLRK